MDQNLHVEEITINDLSPYIRYIHFDDNSAERFYVPWRILYDYEIYYVVSGSMAVTLRSEEFLLGPGDIHIMQPFVWHSRHIPAGCRCAYYSIHFDFLHIKDNDFDPDRVYREPCDSRVERSEPIDLLVHRTIYRPKDMVFPKKLAIIETQRIEHYFREMLFNFQEKPLGYEINLKANLLMILQLILGSFSKSAQEGGASVQNRNQQRLLRIVQEELNQNFDQNINFTELAHRHAISPTYLRALFRKFENLSLTQYLSNLRIEKAKSLLLENRYTVAEIGEMVGYSDAQTFSRLFKKKTGYSPRNYFLAFTSGKIPQDRKN